MPLILITRVIGPTGRNADGVVGGRIDGSLPRRPTSLAMDSEAALGMLLDNMIWVRSNGVAAAYSR